MAAWHRSSPGWAASSPHRSPRPPASRAACCSMATTARGVLAAAARCPGSDPPALGGWLLGDRGRRGGGGGGGGGWGWGGVGGGGGGWGGGGGCGWGGGGWGVWARPCRCWG